MTATKQAKSAGLDNLQELADICNKPKRTVQHWHKTNPELFTCTVIGAGLIKQQRSKQK